MTWKHVNGVGMNLAQIKGYIDNLIFTTWRPSFMVVHNTSAPKLSQWHSVPGEIRMKNLTSYFRDQLGWSSAPHAFVADDLLWPFTPFNTTGTHSPSWNGVSLGIEMVADFDTESPLTGGGLKVYQNTVALFAMLHGKLGIDPQTIRYHREDPKTTHACPGKLFPAKSIFIADVLEYMGHGGELSHNATGISATAVKEVSGVINTPGDTLNVRDQAGMSGKIVAVLKEKDRVIITDRVKNGSTEWLRLKMSIDGGPVSGWVSARYIIED